jgi:methylase of polypeptide subunit release factors
MSNSDFSQYLIEIINAGSLSLMLSIGHKTKIFDVMAELPSSSTVQEIASKSNLNERYVKEWLGAMVTGKIVDYDSSTNKFSLPKEKAQYLTREKSLYNFAASMQWIPVSQVEDEIVNCFNNGGGVPYSSYKRFHEVMAEESYQTVVVALIDHILPLVPNLIDKLKKGINVLDIGCGKGRAINVMANHFKNSNFYGYDLSQEAIDGAKTEAQRMGNSNTFFKVKDILGLNLI